MAGAVHRLIAQTAKEMAGATFETLAQDDSWYATWKEQFPEKNSAQLQAQFVEQKWPLYINAARSTLAEMLKGNYPEGLKEEIADALIADTGLGRAKALRRAPPRMKGFRP